MRLFQPFEQGELGQQAGGAGLGLAIARGLVALLGGALKVESSPALGSRFWFDLLLPIVDRQEGRSAFESQGRIAHLAAASRVRALVVDDVAENREILGSMLRRIGAECRLAGTGAEAIEMFQAEQPDISFLDIRLARFTIEVPPLRERRNDIVLLVDHFLRLLSSEMGLPRPELSPTALATLQAYDYPGNVRELKNLLERALIETGGGRIEAEHLHFLPGTGPQGMGGRMHECRPDPSLPSAEERILSYLQTHTTINNTECRDLLGVGLQRACYLLRKLHAGGKMERDSSGRWAHYRLTLREPR